MYFREVLFFFLVCLSLSFWVKARSLSDIFPTVTPTLARERAHAHTRTHTCAHASFCWLSVLKLLQCTPALLSLQCLTGPVLSQCGLRPRIHPQFVCRTKACLAKQEVSVGSQPSPSSLELENASEQKQSGVFEPQGRINAKNKLIFKCLSGTWRQEGVFVQVLNFVPVAWSELKWGTAEICYSNSWDDDYVSELPRTTARAWQQCFWWFTRVLVSTVMLCRFSLSHNDCLTVSTALPTSTLFPGHRLLSSKAIKSEFCGFKWMFWQRPCIWAGWCLSLCEDG